MSPLITLRRWGAEGGGEPSSIVVLDEFTDVDGTAISGRSPSPTNTAGAVWTTAGAFTILGNRAKVGNDVGAEAYLTDVAPSSYYAKTLFELAASGLSNHMVQLRFRRVDSNNRWHVVCGIDGNVVRLIEMTTGTNVVRDELTSAGVTQDTVHEVRVNDDGNAMSVEFNGTGVLEYASTQHGTAKSVGIYGRRAATYFDDFEVGSQ